MQNGAYGQDWPLSSIVYRAYSTAPSTGNRGENRGVLGEVGMGGQCGDAGDSGCFLTVTCCPVDPVYCPLSYVQLSCYDQAKQLVLSTGYLSDNIFTHFVSSFIAVSAP